MAASVRLGQFNIVGGQALQDGPFAGAVAGRGVADTTADLYITLQPSRPDTDQLCAGVLQTIARTFGHAQYSVTGNLLLALGQAHHNLSSWNRSSLPEHRMGIGVSALAIAGDEAYLAQAGASVAYWLHSGRVERLEPLEGDSRRPLGEGEALDPWFHRLLLAPGDSIALLSADLAGRIDAAAVARCLRLDPDSGVAELFRLAQNERDCGVLLVSVVGEIARREGRDEDEDEPAGAAAAPAQGAPRRAGRSTMPPVPTRESDEPTPGRAAEPFGEIDAGRSGGRGIFGRGEPEPARDEPLPEPPIKPERPRRGPSPLGRNPFHIVRAAHPDQGDGVLRILGEERLRKPRSAPAHALATPEAVLEAANKLAGSRVRMRGSPPGFSSLGHGPRLPRPLLLGGAGLLGVILLAWLGLPALVNSGRSQRFSALIRSAQSEFASANATADLSKRRELLNQAQSNVDEARRLKPGNSQAAPIATSVADALSVMNAVYPLNDVPELADLSAAGLSTSSTVELAAGDAMYVLDVSLGKVFSVSRDASVPPDVAYEDGSQIDGVTAGKARHIAWLAPQGAGDRGTLLILDAAHHLFGLTGNDLRAIPLRGVDQWKSDTALAVAGGDLYVLDAAAGTVWRYARSAGGFDTEPAPAIQRPEVREATGMSVIGGIFLSGQNGSIRHFADGQELQFQLAGIDKPPAAAQPLLYNPQSGALYLPDRGNSRIVVLDANGTFKRQLTQVKLAGLRGAAVDPARDRLIGVIGQSLVEIPLPH
ncbi:MAG TPA: hypothetical protein VKV26_05620 [Dehalococcoidia bacterium]|nr:hypothetical protein [Dehalococcoidia bacterium]